MFDVKKLTIVFRGLMVFHQTVATSDTPSLFEVGLLSPCHHHGNPPHIPRINTYKNGVLDSVMLIGGLVDPMRRIWRLDVDRPLVEGVSTDQQEGDFHRLTHTHLTDYRWLIDLEDEKEFHGPLTDKIDTRRLNPVLRIPSGKFYTRLRSRTMNRQQEHGEGPATNFGMVSAAVGCDIELRGSKAELVVAGANTPIFSFDVDPNVNTLYEIANTPPDTHKSDSYDDHFQHYYEIFISYFRKFQFSPGEAVTEQCSHPAPSPALCGGVRLGKMTNNL